MGFSLLNPLFLAGLVALAIPVLIHLVQRQNPQGQAFPSLMFLRQIPYRERRRREIRHWWLLLLRCLGLLLLVIAFTRPFISGFESAATISAERRDLVILLDRSYSMAYAERWQQAQQIASNALDQLGVNDRSSVILFDEGAQVVNQLSIDHSITRSALNAYQPGPYATNFRAAFDQATRLLNNSDARQREVLLLSDFQSNADDPNDTLKLPPGVTLTSAAEAIEATAGNATVSTLSLNSKRLNQQDIVELSAQISNTGDQAIDQLTVHLELDGRQIEQRRIGLDTAETASLSFDLAPASGAAVEGVLRIADSVPTDALPQDDEYYFVLLPAPKLPVLVVENFGARANQSLFLQRALELSKKPGFQIDIKLLDELQSTDIDDRSIVVLNDVPIPGGEPGDRLASFVESGGGLFVVAADRLQGGWSNDESGYLPGQLGRRVERSQSSGGTINQLDLSHPLLEFLNAPRSGNLSSTQVFYYRQLQPGANDRVLARYDDDAVALIERQYGAGRVMVLTTTLDNHWNTLALQPLFVPLMHRLMSYLAAYQDVPAWFQVADVVDLNLYAQTFFNGAALAADEDLIVQTPSGEQQRLSGANKLLKLTEAGFYEIHRSGADVSKMVIASNVDRRETRFAALDVAAFLERINSADNASPADDIDVVAADPASTPLEQEQQQRLWWYLLLLALLILAAEMLISNRLSSRPQQALQ